MKKQLTIMLILFPILLFAQWPTELRTGLQLSNDPVNYELMKAYCADGVGGYYVCIETNGRLYINHIDLEGNIRWSTGYPSDECFTDQDPGWQHDGDKRGNVLMACNPDGFVWVAWEDFRTSHYDEDYWPTSSDLYIQKFNQDRIALWSPETGILVQENANHSDAYTVHDFRAPRHLEVQDDGSVILMWTDTHQETVPYHGNHWAQRIDSEGNPLWETPGIRMIPNDVWANNWGSKLYHSDGIGGVLFTYLNTPMRLLPTGELAWEFGDVVIEETNGPRDICEGYENTIVFIGDGRRQAGENDLCYATVVDTSGNFVYGPASVDNPVLEFPGNRISLIGYNQYGIECYDNNSYRYYKLDSELVRIGDIVTIDSLPCIHSYEIEMTSYGRRLISSGLEGYQNTKNEAWGWDVDGNSLFNYGLDEDSTNVERPMYDVDTSGNTWVFWAKWYPYANVYVNVISPEGEWGIASNGVDSPSSTSLPSEISLHVYPNPGNGQFTVSFDLVDPNPATIILTNVLGQRVYSFELPRNAVASGLPGAGTGSRTAPQGCLSLDLKDQASGTYFLQLRTESGQVQQKRIMLLK